LLDDHGVRHRLYSLESRVDTRRGAQLTVRLVLLSEPSLWCWEIIDTAAGAIVESSWTTNWTGYTSSPEALRAGIMRLTTLAGGGWGAQPSRTDY
jgi:hypothetical protein